MISPLEQRRIQELEKLAARILEIKRRVRPRRPIVIEFAGSPKSGKTTAISSLDIFLRRNGFRTKVLTERASVCPIPNKFDPIFNVWTGCAALNQLMETLTNSSKTIDVIIMDRGFFDALCWFEWERQKGLLRSDDFDSFVQFFLAPRFRMVVDLVLTFEASPQTSIEREYRNLLTRKEGSVMRMDVLESYGKTLKHAAKKYAKSFRQIVPFATDSKNQNDVSYEVTKLTLDKLQGIADERIGYVPRSSLPPSLPAVFRYADVRDVLEGQLQFNDRELVEQDSQAVQLLPVVVLKQVGQSRYFVARKSIRAVSRRSPEREKLLVYFGGHVREEDSNFLSSPVTLDVLRQCVYREVKEEIGLDVDPSDRNPFCIWVRDGKSDYHLAVVFLVERDLENTRLSIDGEELVRYEKKGKIGTGSILEAGELLQRHKIDSWSMNMLRLFGDDGSDGVQRKLF